MNRKLGKLLAGIATLGAVTFGTMSALPAHAGANGQQIEITNSANYAHVCIYGYNQNSQWTSQCIDLGAGDNWDNNWWWSGPVTLVYYDQSWNYVTFSEIFVPVIQWNSDWYSVTD
jgi:hypothetical protein